MSAHSTSRLWTVSGRSEEQVNGEKDLPGQVLDFRQKPRQQMTWYDRPGIRYKRREDGGQGEGW